MPRTRSAEATIRGFNFQFAATILAILQSEHDKEVVIEGIEDVDLSSANGIKEAIQCKYYEATKLTNSVLRGIVEPMLKDDKNRTPKIKYHVYGYFKGKAEFPLTDAVEFREQVLAYSKGSGSKKTNLNVAEDLGISNANLTSFLTRLRFTHTKKYDSHRDEVTKAIRDEMNCTLDEAKSFFYPNAFTLVSELGTRTNIAERTIKKSDFLSQIDSKEVIYHQWLLQEQEENTFCKTMRRKFFSQTNISPFARFFVVDCNGSEPAPNLKRLVLEISRKWSSHTKRRLSPRNRYSPYICLRNISPKTLVHLKSQLFAEGKKFVDGHPFLDATFTTTHVKQQQTLENQISVRFLSDVDQLKAAISSMTDRTCEIYEFYRDSQIPLVEDVRHIRIPISQISQIEKIV